MNPTLRFPAPVRLACLLISLIALCYIAYVGQDVLTPLAMVGLFAILVRPVAGFMERRLRFPQVLASIVVVLLFVVILGGVVSFVSWQVSDFASDWDRIKRNFTIHIFHLQQYIYQHFGVSMAEQQEYLNSATQNGMKSGRALIGTTLLSATDTLITVTLIPVYMFLILIYRTHIMTFLCKLVDTGHHERLKDIMAQIKFAVKNYLMGLTIEMFIVSFLTALGFYIVGVEYALLLGVLTGLLNLIPYIGIMVACVVSIFASLTASTDISIIVGVLVVKVIVQLVDNNVLVPMIVSSKVQVNALASIVGIIIGGMLAGVTGMFLAIPIIAVLKVVFDRIESLEPWGYLLGDDIPRTFEWHRIRLPRYAYVSPDESPKETVSAEAKTLPKKRKKT